MTLESPNILPAPAKGNYEFGQIYSLPRGGFVINTSIGPVQFGSPPETIKDTMLLSIGVPRIFCLPTEAFNREIGITLAEVEFPVFYNFFLKQRKTFIICSETKKKSLSDVIHSAVFGPKHYNISDDYLGDDYLGSNSLEVPNIAKETEYFKDHTFKDLVNFMAVKPNKSIKIEKVEIIHRDSGEYEIIDNEKNFKTIIPVEIPLADPPMPALSTKKLFTPPAFGITTLGASNGFDPHDNTSGFVLWIGGKGVMIDPPVHSHQTLIQSHVDPSSIDTIILTHTHADHDTGTFQKVISGNRVTIYTTRTVMDSWLYKYSRVSGLDVKVLAGLFDFHSVNIEDDCNIHGANFKFNYTLHSIPTIGFRLTYRNKSFVFSGDHLNDPSQYWALYRKGYLSKKRYDEFINFPWDSDIIFHEAGAPPLHTPVSFLNSLPKEVQKKMFVYHIAVKDMPSKTYLTRAKTGVENTISFNIEKSDFDAAYSVLDSLSTIDLFKKFSIEKFKYLLAISKRKKYKSGSLVIKKGNFGDAFYIILNGILVINGVEDNNQKKRFGKGQYLGEVSVLKNVKRTLDVFAETESDILEIPKSSFLNLISDTDVHSKLLKIAENRDKQSWEVVSSSIIFDKLTPTQRTNFEIILERLSLDEDTVLIKKGEVVDCIYFYHSGEVELLKGDKKKKMGSKAKGKKNLGVIKEKVVIKRGEILGSYQEFKLAQKSNMTILAKKGALIYRIPKTSFLEYLNENPGVYLRFFEAFD